LQAYYVVSLKRIFKPGRYYVVIHANTPAGRIMPTDIIPHDFEDQDQAWTYIEQHMPAGSYMTILPAYHKLNPTAKARCAYVWRTS